MSNPKIGTRAGGDRAAKAAALGATSLAPRPTSQLGALGGLACLAAASVRRPVFEPLRIPSIADRLGLRDWAATLRPGALSGDRLLQKLDAALAAIPSAIEYEPVEEL